MLLEFLLAPGPLIQNGATLSLAEIAPPLGELPDGLQRIDATIETRQHDDTRRLDPGAEPLAGLVLYEGVQRGECRVEVACREQCLRMMEGCFLAVVTPVALRDDAFVKIRGTLEVPSLHCDRAKVLH